MTTSITDTAVRDEILFRRDVEELTGLTPGALYEMRLRHTGPMPVRVGRELVYRRSEVDAFVMAQEAELSHPRRVAIRRVRSLLRDVREELGVALRP
jgi:predicted DNA-binding transcriptional regulator AlpA